MPITNTTALTAMVISSLPFEVIQDVSAETSALQLWYTYTAVDGDLMIGALPYADIASVYEPQISAFKGPASAPVSYKITNSKQRSIQIPAVAGTVYLFKVTQSGAGTPLGTSLTFRLDRAPHLVAPAGAVISTVASGAADWHTPIVSATSQQVYQFLADTSFMHASQGRTLVNGNMIGDGNLDDPDHLNIYDASLTRIYAATPSYFGFGPDGISSNNLDKFYLAYDNGAGVKQVRVLTAIGGESAAAWALPSEATSGAFTVDQANAILYYGNVGAVKRYDLVNSAGLSDLAAALAGYVVHQNMCIMADGTILVGYFKTGGSPDNLIKRYNPAGTVLNTYNFAGESGGLHHFSIGPNPLTFYVWMLSGGATISTYSELLALDGSTVRSAAYDVFDAGHDDRAYDPTYPNINDVPRFGAESTCTMYIVRAVTGRTRSAMLQPNTIDHEIRRLRRAPHLSDEQFWFRYSRFQLDIEAGNVREVDRPMFYDLSWSDDGGHTWSNIHRIEADFQGQYKFRALWRRLGRSRDRVFQVVDSNRGKTVLVDAFITLDKGVS